MNRTSSNEILKKHLNNFTILIETLNMTNACYGNGPLIMKIETDEPITSPNYPEHYPNDMKCTWNVVHADGKDIQLLIKGGNFDLEEE